MPKYQGVQFVLGTEVWNTSLIRISRRISSREDGAGWNIVSFRFRMGVVVNVIKLSEIQTYRRADFAAGRFRGGVKNQRVFVVVDCAVLFSEGEGVRISGSVRRETVGVQELVDLICQRGYARCRVGRAPSRPSM